jgi:hypothetical protein
MVNKMKKINEEAAVTNAMQSGVVVGGGVRMPTKKRKLKELEVTNVFKPSKAAVYSDQTEMNPHFDSSKPPSSTNRRLRRKPKERKKMPYKLAVVESEKALREAIRQLIFLNKIKFFEEQSKVALQENKLRYVIRNLLKEAEETIFDTTGQNAGGDALKKINLTFKQYQKITSTQEERNRYKLAYIAGLRAAFESEDQSSQIFATENTPVDAANLPPAKRKDDLEEQGEEAETTGEEFVEKTEVDPAAEPATVSSKEIAQQQISQAALSAAGITDEETAPNEVLMAKDQLERDSPQIMSLYRQLSDKQITVTTDKGQRTTTDKEDFKKMLVGEILPDGTEKVGNIQIEFAKIDKLQPPNDQKQKAPPAPQGMPSDLAGAAPIAKAPTAAPTKA